VNEHDVAAPRQVNPQTLVLVERLAHAPVADWSEYRGVGRRSLAGNVYVRRDVIAGTAFEDHLLDLVAVALQDTCGLRVQRSPAGKIAQGGAQPGPPFPLVLSDLFGRRQVRNGFRAPLLLFLDKLADVARKHVLGVGELLPAVKDVPLRQRGA